MPRRKHNQQPEKSTSKTPRPPLDLRILETFLMLKLSETVREACEMWQTYIRDPTRHLTPDPMPPPSPTPAPKKLRKRNPVAWKRAESKPAPRHP